MHTLVETLVKCTYGYHIHFCFIFLRISSPDSLRSELCTVVDFPRYSHSDTDKWGVD